MTFGLSVAQVDSRLDDLLGILTVLMIWIGATFMAKNLRCSENGIVKNCPNRDEKI